MNADIINENQSGEDSRRKFLKKLGIMGSIPFLPASIPAFGSAMNAEAAIGTVDVTHSGQEKSIIGQYGPWVASLPEDPSPLSFRNSRWTRVDAWKDMAMKKFLELTASPDIGRVPQVTVGRKYSYDGLEIEEIVWQLPFGRPTEAIVLKPLGASGRLPAILGLHDHGGNKYLGKRKITRTGDNIPEFVIAHQEESYEGKAWANEIAKRGYVVMVHDAFAFGSRRIMYKDVGGIPWGPCNVDGKSDADPENPDNIIAYNNWAGEHEHILSKSLFCGGTTWPGVFLAEDRAALDVLRSRDDVDPERIGCGGLSGGGLRTVYLAGSDRRIKCSVCVGFMSTWKDFLLNKSYTHTWMTYTPLLPKYLDFPEILGLRVPLPAMALNNNEDPLYTLPEMQRADRMLRDIYAKAGVPENYKSGFYPGGHKFDIKMQKEAFDWFDRWLK
ncbi:MAG TPA: hypothetical protein VI583_18200 [Cyclobacteriaceae bacterium]|nr:hypothetical protein [Cyclobacteriaceae bacterium]